MMTSQSKKKKLGSKDHESSGHAVIVLKVCVYLIFLVRKWEGFDESLVGFSRIFSSFKVGSQGFVTKLVTVGVKILSLAWFDLSNEKFHERECRSLVYVCNKPP